MVIAFHFPHNEGVVYGIFDKPGLSTNLTLVDLYEVDGQIQTFNTIPEARDWLTDYKDINEVEVNRVYDIQSEDFLCATCLNTSHRTRWNSKSKST